MCTNGFENGNGVYIGDRYENYISEGKIRLFNDYYSVDGILASGNLDRCRDVLLKYRDMPETSRESNILDDSDMMRKFDEALNGVEGI